MGRILIDPSADFSASPKGHIGLYTSVFSGLLALHELRYSKGKCCHNSADASNLGGSPIGGGANSYSSVSVNVDKDHGFFFSSIPGNGGLSFAFVVKMKNGGTVSDTCVGSFEGTTTATGYIAAIHFNRRIQAKGTTYAAGSTPPLSGFTELAPFIDYLAADDGTYRLFIVTAQNNVALTLYDPGRGLSNSVSAVGRDFVYDNPGAMRTFPITGTGNHDVALFAHWSRVLTSGERATFYAEMKEQVARYGLTI